MHSFVVWIALIWWTCIPSVLGQPLIDLGEPFGRLPLVDEVLCANPSDSHEFVESAPGVSRIETVLGKPCRVLPSSPEQKGAAYFAYRLGKGKGLKPGEAYVLAIDYPEDKPRTFHVVNRGCEVFQGFHTGNTLGDSMHGYVASNAESLKFPLSGKYQTWRQMFFLFERFYGLKRTREELNRPDKPEDGFWVIILRPDPGDDPVSAGPAVYRIRLFRVPDVRKLYQPLRLPPDPLPKRYIFVREEMADGYAESANPRQAQPGVDMTRFFEFKAHTMRFLGINTFCKDLLEFGHNQGWDAGDNNWYVPSHDPKRWERILHIAARYGLTVLPYYEYAGSMGLNRVVQCVPLKGPGQPYTGIWWGELYHADVTDPRTLEDAKRLLDATILRFKGQVRFLGAWFRNRVSHIPISFSDDALERFSQEANGGQVVTRQMLQADTQLLERYRNWWLGKRKAFFLALRDYLGEKVSPHCLLFWTNWTGEPGPPLDRGKTVVTDDIEMWKPLLPQWWEAVSLDELLRTDRYLRSITRYPDTWGTDEWQHGEPRADVENYRDTEGVLFTYPFHRIYSVSRPEDMDAFRTRSGLAMVRMYSLNEHRDGGILGDFLSDVERAGPYCMAAEVRAVAFGDPFYLGYLVGNTHYRGFPEYVRRFNAAFLALPALPSRRLADACADPEVVVRAIPTQGGRYGTYVAVAHIGWQPKRNVRITLPFAGKVVDAVTGKEIKPVRVERDRTVLNLSLDACELRALVALAVALPKQR
ncbi:MAG: hypothetical protein KatS3mg022_0317 [Armatimonadota bacterium]|nr:MAG: hypothetical protein KatS3mg022_0317 [Armatimonadota bacterium]